MVAEHEAAGANPAEVAKQVVSDTKAELAKPAAGKCPFGAASETATEADVIAARKAAREEKTESWGGATMLNEVSQISELAAMRHLWKESGDAEGK